MIGANPFGNLVEIATKATKPTPTRRTFNPRPKGQIQPGSATDEVLRFLSARRDRFHRCHEIETCVPGRSRAAVSWALIYLGQLRLVVSIPDGTRNPRYYRNRLRPEGRTP